MPSGYKLPSKKTCLEEIHKYEILKAVITLLSKNKQIHWESGG